MSKPTRSQPTKGTRRRNARGEPAGKRKISSHQAGQAQFDLCDASPSVEMDGAELARERHSVQWAEDLQRRRRIAKYLANNGRDTVPPAVVANLTHNAVGLEDGEILERIHAEARAAVPALIEEVEQGEDQDSQCRALGILEMLGQDASGAVATLAECLAHGAPEIRAGAARALACIGPAAHVAAPELIRVHDDSDARVREPATAALARACGAVPEALQTLLNAARKDDPTLRTYAVKALRWVQPAPPTVISMLTDLLSDTDWRVKSVAAYSLASIGERAKVAIPAMIGAIKNADGSFCFAVITALGVFREDARNAADLLAEALDDDDYEVRQAAFDTLCYLGPRARALVSHLLDEMEPFPPWRLFEDPYDR